MDSTLLIVIVIILVIGAGVVVLLRARNNSTGSMSSSSMRSAPMPTSPAAKNRRERSADEKKKSDEGASVQPYADGVSVEQQQSGGAGYGAAPGASITPPPPQGWPSSSTSQTPLEPPRPRPGAPVAPGALDQPGSIDDLLRSRPHGGLEEQPRRDSPPQNLPKPPMPPPPASAAPAAQPSTAPAPYMPPPARPSAPIPMAPPPEPALEPDAQPLEREESAGDELDDYAKADIDTDYTPPPDTPAPIPYSPPQAGPAAPISMAPPRPQPEPEPVDTADVRFTAYFPKEAAVETWYSLLVYAHLDSALSRVQADAARYREEMGNVPRETRSAAPAKLARGTEITVVPTCEAITFNPERITLKWIEDMHRAEFRFRAGADLAGSAANMLVTIYVGPLIVGTLKGGLLFDEAATALEISAPSVGLVGGAPAVAHVSADAAQITASLYRQEQIFASYSHDDTPVVLACRDAYRALGYTVLIDIDSLRAGEKWNDDLMRLIDRADIFQLFWSPRSAMSKYCQEEWAYALRKSQGKEGFVRPVYWEKPMVPPPPELADLHFAYVPLPKKDAP